MTKVSTPDGTRTFTSGKSHNGTFRTHVRGANVSDYEKLSLEAELIDFDGEYQNVNDVIIVSLVQTSEEVPATYYVPDSDSENFNFTLEVHRGPLHPEEFTEMNLEVTVFGVGKDGQKTELGSDVVTLRG